MRASRRLVRTAAGWAAFALLVSCGGGGGSAPSSLWVSTDVLVVDVDGDGRADVATLAMFQDDQRRREGRLTVYRQGATPGTFLAPQTTVVGQYPWRMTAADLDGDGRPELVVDDADGKVVLALSPDPARPGLFLAARTIASQSRQPVVADLNDDGAPDLALVDYSSGGARMAIRYQDPSHRGSFMAPVFVGEAGRYWPQAAADVDGDGRADLMVWVSTTPPGQFTPTGGPAVLFRQPGGGLLESGPLTAVTGLNPTRAAIRDFDRDGRADLVVFLKPSAAEFAPQLLVVPQAGAARTFGTAVVTSLAGVDGTDDAAFGDLDQDAVPDAALAGWYGSGGQFSGVSLNARTTVMRNGGAGAFSIASETGMPILVERVAVGDLNGDGRADLALVGDDNQCVVMVQAATPGAFEAPRVLR